MNSYFFIILYIIILNIEKNICQPRIEKITQKPQEKDLNEEKDILKQEKELFEKQIEAFTLGEFTTFEIPPKSEEYIYYQISNTSVLTFAFYLSDINKVISLNLKGPKIEKNFDEKNFVFDEGGVEGGRYIFHLKNENEEKVEISFAIKDSFNKDDNIGSKKLDKITEYIEDMETKINKIRLKQNVINKKTDAHNEGVNKHNKNILINSSVEILVMIVILVTQLLYIKKNISKI